MKMFLFFSHHLTEEQIKDAENMGVDEFITLPESLQYLWSNVPPELADIDGYAEPFYEYLDKYATKGDFALIQGDFGITCRLVSYSREKGVIPVYATTKRNAKEMEKEGKIIKISEFKHIRFRKF